MIVGGKNVLLGEEELSGRATRLLGFDQDVDNLSQERERSQHADFLLVCHVNSVFLRRHEVEKSLCSCVQLVKPYSPVSVDA
jgi:hypothetical protein